MSEKGEEEEQGILGASGQPRSKRKSENPAEASMVTNCAESPVRPQHHYYSILGRIECFSKYEKTAIIISCEANTCSKFAEK